MFFKKGMEPRQFHHEPWFWDPEKEEFEKRIQEAREHHHGDSGESFKASKGFDFKGKTSKNVNRGSRYETNYGKVNPFRLFMLIGVLSALVYYLFF